MKKIAVILMIVTLHVLFFSVVYPWNLGERSLVWELKERYFGDEYAGLRTGYFINENKIKTWHDHSDILRIGADVDLFSIIRVYLEINREIAEDCKVVTSGVIEWHKSDMSMHVSANVLADEPLTVWVGEDEYSLDETERSIYRFESETGMDANELLDTVHLIREEYKAALSEMSEAEYRTICARIQKTVLNQIVIWGIFILACKSVKIPEKLHEIYEKRVDEDMKKYIE